MEALKAAHALRKTHHSSICALLAYLFAPQICHNLLGKTDL